ncbi:MAG: hypothetical protein ACO1OC_09735 [Tuberibacillus sp.]
MKLFMFKLLVLALLCVIVYRNRSSFLKLVLVIECMRRLGESFHIRWMDVADGLHVLNREREAGEA